MKGVHLVFIFTFMLGCTFENKYDTRELKSEVMVLHDEVMPLMDPLYRIRRNLQKKIEVDSAEFSLEQRAKINAVIQEIQDAEDAMMDWMHNFDPNFDGESDSISFFYFRDKKESIKKVVKEMNDAMSKGKAIELR